VNAGSERTAEPEDLPPLELTKLRDLSVKRDSGDDRAPYISSASAVVRRAGHTYVIGDEELELGVFELSSDEPGAMRRALDEGESDDKPDVEALSVLPPFEGAPYGAVLGLGSGSKPTRDRGFFWVLGPRGELEGEPAQVDLKPLYDQLRDELSDLNVEGAAVLGDAFLVFHRGNADEGRNAIAQLDLAEVMDALTGDRCLDVEELRRVDAYELGDLDGTPLCFSDATPVSDDLVVFTASAESEDDGSIKGSVVGTIDAEGKVRRLRTIDRKWKVEGVHASVDSGVIDFVFVCDQDEDEPSPLLAATMPIESGLEGD
jgi:hypothetical protein